MPIAKLKLAPGVSTVQTPTLNQTKLSQSMLIRFYGGLPQKRGGWVQRSATLFAGIASELHGWSTPDGDISLLAVGTATSAPGASSHLYVSDSSGVLTDITPSPVPTPGQQWSIDNYGKVLIALVVNQLIYTWTPLTGIATALGGSSPTRSASIAVIAQVQMVAAFGTETGGIFNSLLVRWTDAGDYTDWVPTATNQAGSYVIPQGSEIVGVNAFGLSTLIWTDQGLTTMVYQGLPFVFGFQPLATGCGLFARRCKSTSGTRIMWLGGHGPEGDVNHKPSGFFEMVYGSTTPQPMECSVWDIFINNADWSDSSRLFMAANELYNEFELFFPLLTSSPFYVENSVLWGAIKYNYIESAWDYTFSAQLQRTAWEHVSPVGTPVGADIAGLLQQHEIGNDANGVGMTWSWQTGDFDLAQGEEMVLVDWIIPDFNVSGSDNPPTINLTVGALTAANATPVTQVLTVTPSTDWTPNFALRGRQFFIGASGSDLGTFNRLGAIRYRAAPDGRGP